MTMSKFTCKLCGHMLELRRTDTGIFYGACKCGKTYEFSESPRVSEKVHNKEVAPGVIKELETQGFPHICKKCGYGECDAEIIGAPYADESDIYLYRCKKCKHVERQADGTGNS